MLFARRDLRETAGKSLSRRFTDQIGRYLMASNDNQISAAEPIEIPACFALLGENTDNVEYDLEKLKHTIQKVIHDYHHKTGRWLDQERIAFAAIWQDTKRHSETLKKQLKHQRSPLPTLSHNKTTSLLRLAFLADALQIEHISVSENLSESLEPHTCSSKLNLPLDETNMTELESIGREIRKKCEAAYLKQGATLEGMQISWRLKLRYENSDKILVLKCMPKEMLREVFEAEHLQQFGISDENQKVIVDELEIEISLAETQLSGTTKTSLYAEQWMKQWQPADNNQSGLLLKQNNPKIQQQFSWLHCPVLQDLLANFVTNQPDPTMPDLFLTNHQKDVDEVVMRN